MAITKITTPELFNLQSNNTEGTQLPVMTTTERIAMTGMSNGELIFNSTTDSVEYYDADAAAWYKIDYIDQSFFNTVLYTGTSGITSITGVGFQPDLVWTKNRDSSWYHQLVDSVRGGSNTVYSNGIEAQGTPVSHIDSLDNDGFTIDYSENIGDNHVAWCFKAGGAAVTNTDGDLASQVSANNDLGFSIVSYNGSGISGNTVGHGLNTTPEFFIIKNLSSSVNWSVYHKDVGSSKKLQLNTTSTGITSGNYANTNPTSSVISFSGGNEVNGGGSSYIAYCFASKGGVSKVGSYTGNGSTTTGNTINVGFEASWIMIKKSSGAQASSSGWFIIDNKRNTSDPWNKYLFANSNQEERTSTASLTSVGATSFTVKSNGAAINQSGSDYIYYAIA